MEDKIRFLGPLERTLYLRSLEPFSDMPLGDLAIFAQKARERFFRKGSTILRKEEELASFHHIVEGQVRVQGREYGDRVLGPNHGIGFLSFISRRNIGVDATTETDTTTLEFNGDDFNDILEDSFRILLHTMRAVANRTMSVRKKSVDGEYFAPAENLPPPPDRELDLFERLLYWTRGGAYQHRSMDAMIELAKASKEVRVEEGHRFWSEGQVSGHVKLILAGTVRCTVPDGRAFRCGPGYPLGNIESMAGQPRWFDAVAEGPMVLLDAETDAFLDVLENHSQMAIDFLAGMAAGLIRILEMKREGSKSTQTVTTDEPSR